MASSPSRRTNEKKKKAALPRGFLFVGIYFAFASTVSEAG
jgi:hypothetical protein